MTPCQAYREQMSDALYDQLRPMEREAFEAHLAKCPGCASEFAETERLLGSLPRRPAPELPAEFWDGYWDRLSRRMEAEKPSMTRVWNTTFFPVAWLKPAALAASVLLLVGLGIFIGRNLPPGAPVSLPVRDVPAPSERSPQPLLARDSGREPLAEHLQRLEPLLIDWSQSSAGETVTVEAADLRRIMLQNHLLKRLLARTGQKDKKRLLDDLELILMEMASAGSDGHPPNGVVRQLIERYDVLFKVRIYSRETKSI
jgi:hypothetical protein